MTASSAPRPPRASGSASRPWHLTPTQAARLALALPNPRDRAPLVQSSYLDKRAARLVQAMRQHGLIDEGSEELPVGEGASTL